VASQKSPRTCTACRFDGKRGAPVHASQPVAVTGETRDSRRGQVTTGEGLPFPHSEAGAPAGPGMQTAINLYSVRELDLPMDDILDRVAAAGYDGVQFSGDYGGLSPGETADALAERGLDVTAAHVDLDAMEADPDSVVEAQRTIGADGAVVPWLGADHFESREAAQATARRLDELASELAGTRDDFGLHYHNHDHEFVAFEETTGFEAFADASSVLLEPDVGWIHTAGHDPVETLERYADRIEVVHMKDMADGEFAEIGEGDVDMQACADTAREIDAEWLVYEHDQPADPAGSIDTGAAFLEDL
jgi:sugar phosphate isomerase/epimerase